MAERYQRTEQAQTGIAARGVAAPGLTLADELERFASDRDQQLDQRANDEGALAGLDAGTRGELGDPDDHTIRGRAFNEAALVAHQAAVQTDIRDSIGRFVVEADNNPDVAGSLNSFQASVAGLSEGLLKDADPRTRSFIQQRVADYAGRAQLQVLETQQGKLRKQAGDDLQIGLQGLFDDATTAAFSGDVLLTEARREELNTLVARGQAGGLIDPAKAADLTQKFEREVTMQEVSGSFDRLLRTKGSDAATASIKSWQATKPGEVGLTVEDHQAVTRQLVQQKNLFDSLEADTKQRTAAAVRADQLLRGTRVKDAIAVMQSGFPLAKKQADLVAADIAWLRTQGALDPTDQVQAAELERDFDTAAAIQGQVHTFRRMTTPQRETELARLRAGLTREGATHEQTQLFQALEKTNTEVSAALQKDPRGYLAGEGLIPQAPLNFSSAADLQASLQARAEGAELGRQLTGQPISRLTAAETDAFATLYQQAEIEERAGLLGIVSAGSGDEVEATLKQIDSQGYKGLALLGDLVRQGRGQLAREVMLGDKIRGSEKQITPKRTDYQADLDAAIGSALIDWPDQRAQYTEAVLSKYAELKARSGDASDTYEPKLFDQAAAAVMPTGELNGRKVLLPARATPDSFEDWLDGLTDADYVSVAGRPDEGMARLVRRRGRLVELGNGRYGVALSGAADQRDKYLLNDKGEPFVLEYGCQALERSLRVATTNDDAYTSRARMEPFSEADLPSAFSDTVSASFALTRREEIAASAGIAWQGKNRERADVIQKLGGDRERARAYSLIPVGLADLWRERELEGQLDSDPTWRAGTPEQRVAYQQLREFERRFPGQVLDDKAILEQSKQELAKQRPVDQAVIERGGGGAAFLGTAGAVMTDPLVLLTLPLGGEGLAANVSPLARVGRVALQEGAVALATEIPIQTAVYNYKREIESPWSFRDSAVNVLAAGVGGAALGGVLAGGVEGYRKALTTYRERKAAGLVKPTADMDAAEQLLEDALHVADENPLDQAMSPSFADEVHTEALETARAQVDAGQPVNVSSQVAGLEKPDAVGEVITRSADPDQLVDIDPLTLQVDARTFQFKAGGDDAGVTGALRDVERFDRRLAGVALVWERADGGRFIADGHQRVGLARRAIAGGQDPAEVRLNGFVLREADGVSAQDARQIAAAKNMAEGSGSAIDAAKMLRAVGPAGEAVLPPLPPRSALVRQARGLAQLGEEEFLQVINGVVDERFGALVGAATDDPKLQGAMIKVLARAQPANEIQARAIVDQVKTQGVETRTTEDLFGEQSYAESLYIERAQVLDQALRLARMDKTVFGGLVANESRIQTAGNRLDRAQNLARQQEATDAATQLSIRANTKGPLSDVLTDAARQVAAGARPATVAKSFLAAARREILQGDSGRGAAGRARPQRAANEPSPEVGRPLSLQAFPDRERVEVLQAFKSRQAGQTIDALYGSAEAHQAALVKAGTDVAAVMGEDVRLVDPGVKKRSGSEEKIARKGYADAGQLTDVIRIGFVTRTPGQAADVLEGLARRFEILDEGVATTELGYVDQKALVRFPDGRVGEIQLWDQALLDAKQGAGHDLYEQVRGLDPEDPAAQAITDQAEEASRALYARALAQADPEWRRAAMMALDEDMRARVQSSLDEGSAVTGSGAVASGKGGADGKASRNAASDSRRPDSSTSNATTRRQIDSPASTKKPSEPPGADRTTAARPSQSKNRSAIDAPPRSIIQAVDDPNSGQPQASRTGTVDDADYESVMSQYQDLQADLGMQLKVTREIDGVSVERTAAAVLDELDTMEESLERIRICSTPARAA